MSNDHFSFLDNIELSEVSATSRAGSARKADSNPTTADIRVFSNGEIYPSVELVEEFGLEYQEDESDIAENGFDLIDSKLWGMLPDGTPRFLAIATIPKSAARKPMLFGKSRKKDGKPVNSVVDQGSTSSGKVLIEYLDEVLGVTIEEGSYVDIDLVRSRKITSNNGIYNLPYTVRKGEAAGTIKSIRRENCEIFPVLLAVEEHDAVPQEAEEVNED